MTVLLNLIRGTGLRGLAGMSEQNNHILRPLLSVSKDEILQYLESIGQDFVTDSTNLMHDAMRNRIRLDIIPLLKEINPQAVSHIAQTAKLVAEAIPYYIKGVESSEGENTTATMHERLRGQGFTPDQERKVLNCERTGAIFESPTHRILIDRGKQICRKKTEDDTPPVLTTKVIATDSPLDYVKARLTELSTGQLAILDADKITNPLTLRHPKVGDRFRPFGMNGRSRLLSDFLTDNKLSRFEKESQWLVCQGEDIVWVAGLRIDHQFRVTRLTKRILEVSVKR